MREQQAFEEKEEIDVTSYRKVHLLGLEKRPGDEAHRRELTTSG